MKQVENKNARIFGLELFGGSQKAWLCEIDKRIRSGKQTAVYTPGAVMLENAARDPIFHAVLSRGDILLPDGMGVVAAAKLLGQPICERIAGVDAAKGVIALAEKRGWKVFLFGGKKGVAETAAVRLSERYPALAICGTCHGYLDEAGQRRLLQNIRRVGADIVLVCLGSPRQEFWIDGARARLGKVKLFMGLGGTLDVFSGRVKRAPAWVGDMGFEWLWRMAGEPKRFCDLPKIAAFSGRILAESAMNFVKMHRWKGCKKPF